MPLQPVPALLEEVLALGQARLAAQAVGRPLHILGRQQQVHIVVAAQQLRLQPVRAGAEQGGAPQHIAQQVGVEDQQGGLLRAGGVFPGQLPAGDGRDVGQAGVAGVNGHEVTHVFAHQQATEVLVQLRGQPALAAGFRTRQYHDLHVRNAGSRRQSRQP